MNKGCRGSHACTENRFCSCICLSRFENGSRRAGGENCAGCRHGYRTSSIRFHNILCSVNDHRRHT
jgi:hypothetical protein